MNVKGFGECVLEETEILDDPAEYPLEVERLSPLIIFLFPFIVGAISVSGLAGANYAVIGLGVLCAVAFLFSLISSGFHIPRETAIFMCFVVWALLGIFQAYSPSVFLTSYSTVLRLLVMVFIITHFTSNTKMARGLLYAALLGAIILAFSTYMSGEYRRAAEVKSERVTGLALNANTFSMLLVYSMGITLYFFKTAKSWLVKGFYVAAVLLIAKLIIASGSRAGFISLVLLGGVWYCLSYIPEIRQKPAKTIGMSILIVIGMVVLFSSLSNTTMYDRLKQLTTFMHGSRGGSSIEERHALALRGIELIVQHPVVGIGLNQYILVSGRGLYSHNNYIEVFCDTGIIGGLIYYSLYISLYLRLRRVGKMIQDIKGRELVCLAKTVIIVMCISDAAIITYYDKQHWILLAIFIGWAHHFERELTSNNTYAQTADEFAITEYH